MAKFHAEWSKKFYDVFVPLLKEWQKAPAVTPEKQFREDRFTWKAGDVQIYTDEELKKAGLKIMPPEPVDKNI